MAITINGYPNNHTPAYNDIDLIVISDNIAEANFRYVADLYINGVFIQRLSASKDLVYDTGVFNFGRIIENYVASDIDKDLSQFQQNLNSYVSYYVKFGEEYGATPVVYPSLTTSNTYYAWNAIWDFLPFQEYSTVNGQWDYVFRQSFDEANFLTNRPSSGVIRYNEDAWLYLTANSANDVSKCRVKTYDVSNNLLQTVDFVNSFYADGSTNSRFLRLDCGTNNLNLIPSSGITAGAQPIIVSSGTAVDHYTISAVLGANEYTNSQTFVIDTNCTKNVEYRFHFLNKLGGFDSFTFYRGSNKSSTINRDSYEQNPKKSISAYISTYNTKDRGMSNFDIKISDNISVESDWVDEDTLTWLEELVYSPEVYVDDATYGLVAVNITNSNHVFKQEAQDKVFNLKLDFKYSYNRYRQRK